MQVECFLKSISFEFGSQIVNYCNQNIMLNIHGTKRNNNIASRTFLLIYIFVTNILGYDDVIVLYTLCLTFTLYITNAVSVTYMNMIC